MNNRRLTALVLGASLLAAAPVSAQLDDDAPLREEVRLRFGVDGGLQAGVDDDVLALGVATHVRIGAQLGDYFALYYQAAGIVGGGVRLSIGGTGRSSGIFMHSSSAMAEVTLGDLFQLAAGPSLFAGARGLAGAAQEVGVYGGGLSARAALSFGGGPEGQRSGFSLGVQTDAGWFDQGPPLFMVGVTAGWELF